MKAEASAVAASFATLAEARAHAAAARTVAGDHDGARAALDEARRAIEGALGALAPCGPAAATSRLTAVVERAKAAAPALPVPPAGAAPPPPHWQDHDPGYP